MILRLIVTENEVNPKMGHVLWICSQALKEAGFVVSQVNNREIEVYESKEVPKSERRSNCRTARR